MQTLQAVLGTRRLPIVKRGATIYSESSRRGTKSKDHKVSEMKNENKRTGLARSGPCFSKVPKSCRTRRAIATTAIRLFLEGGLFFPTMVSQYEAALIWHPK